MWIIGQTDQSAAAARGRLLDDQLVRPLVEQRSTLTLLTRRLERAGRDALIRALAGRVAADPRYMPVLQKLLKGAGSGGEEPAKRAAAPVDPRRLVAARSQLSPDRR